ncbi:MAG: HepT-like ribonuclease domain-containing protein [Egibacteraceae bacterium]
MGEAAKHLSEDVIRRAPEIPWRRIVGFRNVVVHEYWDRDPDIIANTVDEHLPQLDSALVRVQRELIEERGSRRAPEGDSQHL